MVAKAENQVRCLVVYLNGQPMQFQKYKKECAMKPSLEKNKQIIKEFYDALINTKDW